MAGEIGVENDEKSAGSLKMEDQVHCIDSKKDNSSRSFCINLLRSLSYVTVEPAVLGTKFVLVLYTMLAKQYVYVRLANDCNLTETIRDTSCNETTANASDPQYLLMQRVSTETSQWMFYFTMATFIPAIFSTAVLGSWSDKHGRKFPILVSLFGIFILILDYVIVVTFDFHMGYLLIGHFLSGVCGDSATLLACSFSHITDITHPTERTLRITVLETCLGIGGFIASLGGGIWIKNHGFVIPLWVLLLVTLVDIVYIALRLESKKGEKLFETFKCIFTKEPFVHMHEILKPQLDDKKRHINICLFLTSYFFVSTAIYGVLQILVVYEIGLPFCWNSVQVGISRSAAQAGYFLILALIKIFSSISAEVKLLIAGVMSNVFSSIIFAFAIADWMIYFGLVVQMLSFMPSPIMRSQASRLVSKSEVGPIFALVSCITNIAIVTSAALFNNLYGATVDSSIPGAAFLLSPILLLIFSAFYHLTYKRAQPVLLGDTWHTNEDDERHELQTQNLHKRENI